MTRAERNELAKEALSAARFVTAGRYARANCPFCLNRVGKEDFKQCFAVDTRLGWYRCWRCAIVGRIDGYEQFDIAPSIALEVAEQKATMQPPEGFRTMKEMERSLGAEEARQYLLRRGLAPEIWEAAGIGACLTGRFAGRIVVPVLSPEGEWVGWVARAWTKKAERPYMNAPGMSAGSEGYVYNHAALLKETSVPVLVVEGVFDALAYWPDAVAVLGKPAGAQIQALAAARRPVVVVLDGDAWQEAEGVAMRLQLEGHREATWVKLPPKTDPDEVDRIWLRETARSSVENLMAWRTETALRKDETWE